MKKLAFLLLLLALAGIWLLSTSGASRKVYSPDKQYSVYSAAYNYEALIPKMPGDGSSASGKVYLYDEIEQKVLESAPIVFVGAVHEVRWREQEAFFIGDEMPHFDLPRPVNLEGNTE